jgi:glycerol uptake operon antiterminator
MGENKEWNDGLEVRPVVFPRKGIDAEDFSPDNETMRHILLRKKEISGAADFHALLHENQVILAVKSMEGLELSRAAKGSIVFVLFGDILSIPEIVATLKTAGKTVLVHLDLIDGLSTRDVAVDFLVEHTRADGILSTKANLLKHAKSRGLLTIQRFFVLDSLALLNIEKQFPLEYADAVEILPGLMPKVIRRIVGLTNKPVIVGGLISDADDVRIALEAGAVSVSTSNCKLL